MCALQLQIIITRIFPQTQRPMNHHLLLLLVRKQRTGCSREGEWNVACAQRYKALFAESVLLYTHMIYPARVSKRTTRIKKKIKQKKKEKIQRVLALLLFLPLSFILSCIGCIIIRNDVGKRKEYNNALDAFARWRWCGVGQVRAILRLCLSRASLSFSLSLCLFRDLVLDE